MMMSSFVRRSAVAAILSWSTLPVFGQITQANLPELGDTIHVVYSNLAVQITPGQSGVGQNWTFGHIGFMQDDTLFFDDPAVTPWGNEFPTANYTVHGYNDGNVESVFWEHNYWIVGANGVEEVGRGLGLPSGNEVPIELASSFRFMEFPSTFGTCFRDTTAFELREAGSTVGFPVDSVLLKGRVYRKDTIDGTGILQIPGFSFTDVFRKHTQDVFLDTIFMMTSGQWQIEQIVADTVDHYSWWSENETYSLLELSYTNDTLRSMICRKFFPNIKLEIGPVQDTVMKQVAMTPFSLSAIDLATGLIAPNFNDTVLLIAVNDTSLNYLQTMSVVMVGGQATVSDFIFHQPGDYRIVASTAMAIADTSESVLVIDRPVKLRFDDESVNVSSPQAVISMPVRPYYQNGMADMVGFNGYDVRIGKLSGPGELLGTKTRTVMNGTADFNDIRLTHPGQYEILAFHNIVTSGPPNNLGVIAPDTLLVNVANDGAVWSYQRIDSLSVYLDRASFFVWTGNADGYLAGTSRIPNYYEIGQHFDFTGQARITDVMLYFAFRSVIGDSTDSYKLRIYDAGVAQNRQFSLEQLRFNDTLPLVLLAEQEFFADSIKTGDFFQRRPTVIHFDVPATVNSGFIVALETNPATANDTVSLWTSIIGDGMGEGRTVRRMYFEGQSVDTTWLKDLHWRPSYDVDLMMVPILEVDSTDFVVSVSGPTSDMDNISVYPNPAVGQVSISANRPIVRIAVISMSGSLVHVETVSGDKQMLSIHTDGLAEGVYSLDIYFGDTVPVRRKLIVVRP